MRSPQEKLARYEQLIPHLHNTQNALWEMVNEDMMRSACGVMAFATKCPFLPREEDSIALMLNYCCFNLSFDGYHTLTDLYVERQRSQDEDLRLILEAHRRSYFSLFAVVRLEPDVGAVLRDVFTDEDLLVVYPRLAQSTRPGQVLAVRVMPVEDFHVLFNGPVPLRNPGSVAEFQARQFQIYGRYGVRLGCPLTPQQRGTIETFETIHTLSARYPELMPSHARKAAAAVPPTPGSAPAPRRFGKGTLPLGQRVGRNDPCPCGSGKKFKQCCLERN